MNFWLLVQLSFFGIDTKHCVSPTYVSLSSGHLCVLLLIGNDTFLVGTFPRPGHADQ